MEDGRWRGEREREKEGIGERGKAGGGVYPSFILVIIIKYRSHCELPY
jgi:hypothetical protein